MNNQAIEIMNLKECNDLADQTTVKFVGRIKKVRNLGKLKFFIVQNQDDSIQVVSEKKECSVKAGEHVCVVGSLCKGERNMEIKENQIEIIGSMNSPITTSNTYFTDKKMELLFIRAKMIEEIHAYFGGSDFMHVHSPSIVSDWVEGQTGAFKIKFYDEDCYLSISNMMYHEIMMINGFSRIYEVAKIFRQEHPSTMHRLAEFTIIDIGIAYSDCKGLMEVVNGMILHLHKTLLAMNIKGVDKNIEFETIDYYDLVNRAGVPLFDGSQFPKEIRSYLKQTFTSFVWVTGFPDKKRPFFVKSIEGVCCDCQLWYKGKIYLAAGGERETDLERIRWKILQEKKDLSNYEYLLSFFETNVPPMCGIGMGIERFLASMIPDSYVADYIAFPRYQNHFIP